MEYLDPDNVAEWLASLWNPKNNDQIVAGINDDDCAVIKIGDETLVFTTDFLNASPIAVELGICTYSDLGRLVVASNISDLCGSGATPISFMTGITMRKNTNLDDFKNLMKGIKYELDKYNIPLIGGDTKLGKSEAFIGFAIGNCENDSKLFLKNAAKPNDEIWLSGEVGSVSAAVYGYDKMTDTWKSWANKVLISPNVPFIKSQFIAKAGCGHGGIDISDGLGIDLHNLATASKVGVNIDLMKIPINKKVLELADACHIPASIFPFVIGGDFQFIVTGAIEDRKIFNEAGFTKIGIITDEISQIAKLSTDKYIDLPIFGHSDKTADSFKNEVELIVNKLRELIKQ